MQPCGQLGTALREPANSLRLQAVSEQATYFYENVLGFAKLRRQLVELNYSATDILRLACDFVSLPMVRAILEFERGIFELSPIYASGRPAINGPFFSGLMLMQTPAVTISLMCINGLDVQLSKDAKRESGGGSIMITGTRSLYKILRADRLVVRRWQVPEFTDALDLSLGSIRCDQFETHTLQDACELDVYPWQSLEFVESAQSSLMLKVEAKTETAPFSIEFDVLSGLPIGISAVTQQPMRLQMQITALAHFKRHDAIPEMERLLGHEFHFVRWHVMRELLGLNARHAYPHLARMAAEDPQPAVRRAASATIARFFPQANALDPETREAEGDPCL